MLSPPLGRRTEPEALKLVPGSGPKGPNDPDPWADLESRSPLRAPGNYAVVVYGTIIGALLSRSFQGLGKVEGLWMGHSGFGGGGGWEVDRRNVGSYALPLLTPSQCLAAVYPQTLKRNPAQNLANMCFTWP